MKRLMISWSTDDGKDYKYVVRKGERGYVELSTADIQQRERDRGEDDQRASGRAIVGAKHFMDSLLEKAVVTVTVDGANHQFGMDKATREQVMARITIQAAGLATSTQWTPKGMRHPISMTPEDMKKVAQAMLNLEDQIISTYLTHKGNLMLMTTALEVKRYDYKKGYSN